MNRQAAIIVALLFAASCAVGWASAPRQPELDHFTCLERGIVPDPYLKAEWRAARAKWKGLPQ